MRKAQDLARLAADERTPEGERIAAALALAKLVARDGVPAARRSEAFAHRSVSDGELHDLRRERDALAEITRQNADELRALRAEKAELERRLQALGDETRGVPRRGR